MRIAAATTPQDQLGIWMTSALVVGTIIGAGIFLLPVSLAPLGINALPAGWSAAPGCFASPLPWRGCPAWAATGIQANIEREFGPTVAFLVAWAFWVSNWVAQASVAMAAASALSFAGPQLGGPAGIILMAIGCLVLLTAINAIGVRAAGGFSLVTVAIKILPLLAVIWLFAERGVGGRGLNPCPVCQSVSPISPPRQR